MSPSIHELVQACWTEMRNKQPCRLSVAQVAALEPLLPDEILAVIYAYGYKTWDASTLPAHMRYLQIVKGAKVSRRKLDFNASSKLVLDFE